MKPKLSVIIASYNHQDYIAETLESLEKQTFQDFEIIVVDDGSTDKTVEVAKNFPSRAQIFTQENINIDYIYGSESEENGKASLFLKVSDPQKAFDVLKKYLSA